MAIWRMRIACRIPKATHTHTQYMQYSLLYHYKNGCTNTPQCYVIRVRKSTVLFSVICDNVKGKAIPLQAWSGPEGSRKLRFPDFMTTAQYGSKVVSPTHRPPLPPGNFY